MSSADNTERAPKWEEHGLQSAKPKFQLLSLAGCDLLKLCNLPSLQFLISKWEIIARAQQALEMIK